MREETFQKSKFKDLFVKNLREDTLAKLKNEERSFDD